MGADDTLNINLSDPVLYRDYSRIILRTWSPILSPSELAIVLMVFDRTIGWGKEWEYITYADFTDGVRSPDGRCYHGGLSIGRATVSKLLKTLCMDEFIGTRPGRSGGNKYAVNFSRKPKTMDQYRVTEKPTKPNNQGVGAYKMPQPKEPTTYRGVQKLDGPVQKLDYPVQNLDPKRRIEREGIGEKENPPPPASEVLGGIVQATRRRALEAREALLANRSPQAAELAQLLQGTWADAYPGVQLVAPKLQEWKAVRGYVLRYDRANPQGTPFAEYFAWCVGNWRMIMNQTFGWMEDPPLVFDPFFYVKFSGKFEASFIRRQEMKVLANMPLRDRMIFEKTQKGMDQAAATAEVDEFLEKNRPKAPVVRPAAPVVNRNARFVQHVAQTVFPSRPVVVRDAGEIDYDAFKL